MGGLDPTADTSHMELAIALGPALVGALVAALVYWLTKGRRGG